MTKHSCLEPIQIQLKLKQWRPIEKKFLRNLVYWNVVLVELNTNYRHRFNILFSHRTPDLIDISSPGVNLLLNNKIQHSLLALREQ
jgi:hypothetical protein